MDIVAQHVLDAVAGYNETEVRFHIVDPILRRLGYPGRPETYLKLEEKLEYPYYHIGHKSKKKDLPLGYPDYRAGLLGRRGSFVVEAKSPNSPISPAVVEQAHSYAAHAQIGANYFVLCDGLRFQIFATLSGHGTEPVVELEVGDLNSRFFEIENILAPERLGKLCQVIHDRKLGLADGWPSKVLLPMVEYQLQLCEYRLIQNGADVTAEIKNFAPQLALLDTQLEFMKQLNMFASGQAERDDNGRIVAVLDFKGISKGNHEAMQIMGMNRIIFETDEETISTNSDSMTVFESNTDFAIGKGVLVPQSFGGVAQPMEQDVAGNTIVSAAMYRENDTIKGKYGASVDLFMNVPFMDLVKIEFDFSGDFNMVVTH
ncbi:type I restriction enzyme HsdR N-terminal domain-containing protein [Ruegeria pomeroyi]|nr:type I restriction enzyme HsdR N-terminal domain-containing protein [Ruegeria pomeroyi]